MRGHLRCGKGFAELFKQQIDDERVNNFLDSITARVPTEVMLFEVAKERDTRKVTERIAELMYTVLLRELDYAEDFDIAELEIELEAEGKLDEFVETCRKLHPQEWRIVREKAHKNSPGPVPCCTPSTQALIHQPIRGHTPSGTEIPPLR